MGPLKLLDLVGLDVSAAIGDEIGVDVPERVRSLVAEGKLELSAPPHKYLPELAPLPVTTVGMLGVAVLIALAAPIRAPPPAPFVKY